MKVIRNQLFWIGSIGLLWMGITFVPPLFGLPLGNGFSGLVIYFFLGYCAIILVAQLFSALKAVRSIVENWTERKKKSRRVALR